MNEIRFLEVMRYLGLWSIMLIQVKTNVHKYFSPSEIGQCTSGALFKLNDVMAYNVLPYAEIGASSQQ